MRKSLSRLEAAIQRLVSLTRSRRGWDHRAERAGLSLSRAPQQVLRRVIEGGPARISDLARATGTGESAVSRLVTALEGQGLLERAPDARDARAVRVRASRAGQGAARRLRRAADEIFEERLAGWSDADAEKLAQGLERLARDLAEGPR
jgi:DNA-binding MarR family transcriptional regulator